MVMYSLKIFCLVSENNLQISSIRNAFCVVLFLTLKGSYTHSTLRSGFASLSKYVFGIVNGIASFMNMMAVLSMSKYSPK